MVATKCFFNRFRGYNSCVYKPFFVSQIHMSFIQRYLSIAKLVKTTNKYKKILIQVAVYLYDMPQPSINFFISMHKYLTSFKVTNNFIKII